MKILLRSLVFMTATLAFSPAFAAEQVVRFSVPSMHCPSCPFMVKQVISAVEGVKSVEATMEDRTATVVFDDEVVTLELIQQATASIGYESTPIIDDDNS